MGERDRVRGLSLGHGDEDIFERRGNLPNLYFGEPGCLKLVEDFLQPFSRFKPDVDIVPKETRALCGG